MHHGCTKVSYGCQHCYMFHRDEAVGKDPTKVVKTQNFNLPVRRLRSGPHRGLYKIPSGSHIYTCFSSDFFHKDADEWRDELWDMIQTRSDCTFFMITKRPERIADHLPYDAYDWDHVTIAVTCENQWAADKRLPIYLALPLRHHSVMIEPMLSAVNLRRYFHDYTGIIESVSVGGESGPGISRRRVRAGCTSLRLFLGSRYACAVCGKRSRLLLPSDRCQADKEWEGVQHTTRMAT